MKNPIPLVKLFATPVDFADLEASIEILPPKDKALVYRYVMMAINTCHAEVNKAMPDEVKVQRSSNTRRPLPSWEDTTRMWITGGYE